MQSLPLPSSWAPQWIPSYKPWLDESDAKDTFFGSVHLYMGEHFYPGTGSECDETYNSHTNTGSNICNITLTSIGPGPCSKTARDRLSQTQKIAICQQASTEMKKKMLDKMLPALERFHPDLLIISSGFDAHYDDMYHYLTEQDYHWMTEKLCSVAENNGGKVISVLEGGYSLSTPVPSSKLHKKVTAAAIADNKIYTSIDRTSSTSSTSTAGKFAQEPGDGGLVKSVLAHTAALSGLPHWHTEH